uniref:Uncharacterized protein n=1 Tax=Pipistrellus kuhlii TaxID=59472 RepID=A0A7J7ZK18_PIPKU|nr:hypothetical protein mPipKuh1_009657 [Pipistrellus kuhlii]
MGLGTPRRWKSIGFAGAHGPSSLGTTPRRWVSWEGPGPRASPLPRCSSVPSGCRTRALLSIFQRNRGFLFPLHIKSSTSSSRLINCKLGNHISSIMSLVTLLRQEIKAIKHFRNDRVHAGSHFSYVPVLFFKRPFMILILNSLKSEESVESVECLRYRAQILHLLMHLLKWNMWWKTLKHKIQYG